MQAPVDYPVSDDAHDAYFAGDELAVAVLLDRHHHARREPGTVAAETLAYSGHVNGESVEQTLSLVQTPIVKCLSGLGRTLISIRDRIHDRRQMRPQGLIRTIR